MKTTLLRSVLLATLVPACAFAATCPNLDEVEQNPEAFASYPNECYGTSVGDSGNTSGSGADGATSVDVVSNTNNSNDSIGALEGEITVKEVADIFEVYANGNLVERLVKGIGSIGSITKGSSILMAQFGSKPLLNCALQDGSVDWYGPCKVPDQAG